MTSLDKLEREAEAQRARFAEAIDGIRLGIEESANNLRENFSPARIMHRNSEKLRDLTAKSIHENPIQVASAAALLVYPAWRLARVLPMPMVVAGLGVFLAGKARSNSTSATHILAEGNRRARDVIGQVADASLQARESAANSRKKIAAQSAESVSAANEAIQDAGRSVAASAGAQLAHAADSASGILSDAIEAVRPSDETIQSIKDGTQAIKDSTQAAAASAKDLGRRAAVSSAAYSRGAANAVAENPILVAGLGLAVGSLLAALLPAKASSASQASPPSTLRKTGAAKMHASKHSHNH